MRQAIVIKNPKWEPFTKASDAFKATGLKEGESAVLVVRGRCKEKAIKVIRKLKAAVVSVAVLFAMSSFAQEPIINKLAATTFVGASTNSSVANGIIGWNIDAVAVLQLSIVGTNAATTGQLRVAFDTSDNGTDWLANQYTVTMVATGVSTASSINRITNTIGGKWLRFGSVANTNAMALTIQRVTLSVKE